ncbi:MAG: hypothetical protein QOF77_938 [Solirubrobacteraceae bacterium]|nr:hypothetical protein [Solirubrobacteraceae bacterium]
MVRVCGPDVAGELVERTAAEVAQVAGDGDRPGPAETVARVRETVRAAALEEARRSTGRIGARLRRAAHLRAGCAGVPGLLRERASGRLSAAETVALYRRLDRCSECARLTGRLDAAEWHFYQAVTRPPDAEPVPPGGRGAATAGDHGLGPAVPGGKGGAAGSTPSARSSAVAPPGDPAATGVQGGRPGPPAHGLDGDVGSGEGPGNADGGVPDRAGMTDGEAVVEASAVTSAAGATYASGATDGDGIADDGSVPRLEDGVIESGGVSGGHRLEDGRGHGLSAANRPENANGNGVGPANHPENANGNGHGLEDSAGLVPEALLWRPPAKPLPQGVPGEAGSPGRADRARPPRPTAGPAGGRATGERRQTAPSPERRPPPAGYLAPSRTPPRVGPLAASLTAPVVRRTLPGTGRPVPAARGRRVIGETDGGQLPASAGAVTRLPAGPGDHRRARATRMLSALAVVVLLGASILAVRLLLGGTGHRSATIVPLSRRPLPRVTVIPPTAARPSGGGSRSAAITAGDLIIGSAGSPGLVLAAVRPADAGSTTSAILIG